VRISIGKWQGRGWVTAGEQRVVCELAFNAAGERHGKCKSAFNHLQPTESIYMEPVQSLNLNRGSIPELEPKMPVKLAPNPSSQVTI
jgi:hypothetical protein